MRPTALLAIGRLTLLAGLRSAPLWALLVAMTGMTALAPRIVFFGFGDEARIRDETAASALRLTALLLALATGLPRRREAEFDALVLARPLSAAALHVGRFLGVLALVMGSLTWLSVVHYGTLHWAGLERPEIGALWAGAALEALVVTALAAAAGAILPRVHAAVLVVIVFALAHAGGALSWALPRPLAAHDAALLAGAYLSLGAAAALAREPSARHGGT